MLGNDHNNKSAAFRIGNSLIQDEVEIANEFTNCYANVGLNTAQSLPSLHRNFENYLQQQDFLHMELEVLHKIHTNHINAYSKYHRMD